jgi:hypothetical protein
MTVHNLVISALWTFNVIVLCPGSDARLRDLQRLRDWLLRRPAN